MSSVNENIPEGWVETTLGEVCIVESGGTPSTKIKSYWNGTIGWITPKDLSNYKSVFIEKGERSITEEGLKNSSTKLLPKHSILFSSRAPIGYVVIANNEIATNQGFKNLICDEKKSHYKYFYYLLKLKANYIEKLSSGSTFSEASATLIKSIEVNIPKKIEEQKAIANILTAFDDKIENLQAQNKTLEQTAQTIFKEWFGKYQVGDELPDGSRVGNITELFEIRDGTHDSPKQKKTGYKLITSKHLGNNRIKLEDAYLISEEDYINVNKRSRVEQFDILVSMIGTIGLTYLEQNELINYAIKNVALFKTSQNKTFSIYTYLWLKSSFGKYFFETSKSGTTQEYISLKSFRAIELIVPDDRTINNFNEMVFNLFGKIKNNTAQIQTLKKTRDTLLPKLMSGQLRVNI